MSETVVETETPTGVELQIRLEQLYSKNQLIPRIKAEFKDCKDFNFTEFLQLNQIPLDFGFDLMTQMVIHKQADLSTLVGILRHHLNDGQATADMITRALEAELLYYVPTTQKFIVRFLVSQEVQDDLDRFQYPLPMVVPPREVTNNLTSGYYLNKRSLILNDNHHNGDVCLDHINRLNEMSFVINMGVIQMVKNSWKNLDKRKEGEDRAKFEQRKRDFAKYDRVAKQVIDLINQAPAFYFTHAYDKRGRTYCMGYHVNYQGNPWNKACIEFAQQEIVE